MDLFMKDNVKLHIVQVYFLASISDKPLTLEIHKFVQDTIVQAFKENKYLIIMGDYNLQYELYMKQKKKGHLSWNYQFMKFLDDNHLFDSVAYQKGHDNLKDDPNHTFTPINRIDSHSRIDYIYMSSEILNEMTNTRTFEMDLFNTDHSIVITSIYTEQIFNQTARARLIKNGMKKTVFEYQKMNKDLWEEYANEISTNLIEKMNSLSSFDNINDQ